MTKLPNKIPLYNICQLGENPSDDIVVQKLDSYLAAHYDAIKFPHRHSFYHLVLFTSGSGSFTIDFMEYTLAAYQMYFMAPGQVHSWDFGITTNGYVVNFSEQFIQSALVHPGYLDRFSFLNGISGSEVVQLRPGYRKEVHRLFEMLYATHIKETLREDWQRLKLLELFILVESQQPKSPDKPIAQQKMVLLNHFRKLINEHYKDLRLPKAYADMLYITPNHLNALCQDMLHKTAGAVIRERIILEAKRLLLNAGATVAEIAYELNFQDNSYFNRFFKKNVGFTPDEFRKQNMY